ncbi:unnamed protein product [Symbiodinium natans]|uniref:Uncharacterized protein n=1 Tax=Symbiodinium natans TaxID=878477 RepID=A0A812U291_9DINO|nr:unnamed protein product [Symbiodinium natans]
MDRALDDEWEFVPARLTPAGRRRRFLHGSLADLSARSTLPSGPASLTELFNYPVSLVEKLCSTGYAASQCKRLLADGIVQHSDYSGIGAEREVKRLLLQVLREEHALEIPHMFTKSCDIDVHCQEVLKHASHILDKGSSCVFADIMHQLVPEAQNWCAQMIADMPERNLEEQCKINKEILEFLMQNMWVVDKDSLLTSVSDCECFCHGMLLFGFGQEHKAHCLVHGQDCIVHKSRASLPNPRALVVADAGNCCQAWSSEGKRARGSHASQVPLAAWLCMRKHLAVAGEEDLFFQECTPLFDVDTHLRQPLKDSHRIIKVIAGPRLLGWPCSRDRLLSAGLNLHSLVWLGPKTDEEIQAEFEGMFGRCPHLNGSVFLQEDDSVHQAFLRDQLGSRGHYPDIMPEGQKLFNKLLVPGQQQRLAAYQQRAAERAALDGTCFCDLEHWPDSPGPAFGPMMPCLLTHGNILELSRSRFVLPAERFLSLGFHAMNHVSSRFFWPLASTVLRQPDRVTKRQSGNSQSLPIVLAWNLYVFGSTVQRERCEPLVSWLSNSSASDNEDAEAEAGTEASESSESN